MAKLASDAYVTAFDQYGRGEIKLRAGTRLDVLNVSGSIATCSFGHPDHYHVTVNVPTKILLYAQGDPEIDAFISDVSKSDPGLAESLRKKPETARELIAIHKAIEAAPEEIRKQLMFKPSIPLAELPEAIHRAVPREQAEEESMIGEMQEAVEIRKRVEEHIKNADPALVGELVYSPGYPVETFPKRTREQLMSRMPEVGEVEIPGHEGRFEIRSEEKGKKRRGFPLFILLDKKTGRIYDVGTPERAKAKAEEIVQLEQMISGPATNKYKGWGILTGIDPEEQEARFYVVSPSGERKHVAESMEEAEKFIDSQVAQ